MGAGQFYNIGIKRLSVGYGLPGKNPVVIRQGINFSATHGEMVALIGSNGIGKSTLLRTLVGFQDYFSGEIVINNKPLQNYSVSEKSKLISFVSTEPVKVANMTVFDLVAYGRFPYTNWFGKLTSADNTVIQSAIKSVGLEGFENKHVVQISDGERQRAMIARALAQDTPIIILDEPTAFLDVSNKYEIFHLLQVLASEKGKTIILSTHDLNIALREVDKFWILFENETYEGAPEDAVLDGKFEEIFKNSHIGFDPKEGEYFFRKNFKSKVKVEGEGLPLSWTFRALNRAGYQIVTESTPDFIVKILKTEQGSSWVLNTKTGDYCFLSIYDLFQKLSGL